jgi:hypothetical protein
MRKMIVVLLAMVGVILGPVAGASAIGSYPSTDHADSNGNSDGTRQLSWITYNGNKYASNDNGHNAINVVDYTGSFWPVHDAVNTVNAYLAANSQAISIGYYSSGSGCRGMSGRTCIVVTDLLGGSDLGNTFTTGGFCSLNAGNGIAMNNTAAAGYSLTARKSMVMHELYHALGMGHTGDPNDLMYHAAGTPDGVTPAIGRGTPSAGDSTQVLRVYGNYKRSSDFPCN